MKSFKVIEPSLRWRLVILLIQYVACFMQLHKMQNRQYKTYLEEVQCNMVLVVIFSFEILIFCFDVAI